MTTNIVMYRGDDRDFLVTVTAGGVALDLTGYSVISTFRTAIDAVPTFVLDSSVVLGTGFEIDLDPDQTGAGKGKLTLHVRSADTIALVKGTILLGDLQLTDSSGNIRTAPEPSLDESTLIKLRIREDVTHP